MNWRNNICCLLVLSLVSATCRSKGNANHANVKIDAAAYTRYFTDGDLVNNKVVIFYGQKCGCFIQDLNKGWAKDSSFIKTLHIYGDTSYNRLRFPINHLPQSCIDTLSEDIYNVTLMKKGNGKIDFRILETTESGKFVSIAKKFFE
jgi:hypothetical protein